MIFGFLIVSVASGIALLLIAVLYRANNTSDFPASGDIDVYRAQLGDVDRDVARGVINANDAERMRTEIARRILSADTTQHNQTDAPPSALWHNRIAAALILTLVVAGSAGLYWKLGAAGYDDQPRARRIAQAQDRALNRPSQVEMERQTPSLDLAPELDVDPDYLNLVNQLRTTMEKRLDDPRGFALLSEHEANLGNYRAAYHAKDRYITLQNGDIDGSDLLDVAELMILAVGGYVSPEAEKKIRQVLVLEGRNARARYFYGLTFGQIGRPDKAFRVWADTLRSGEGDPYWLERIESQIPDMAALAGERYTPPAPQRGPTAEDIVAAADLNTGERMDMARAMVQQLSDRLATDGGEARDWARLITSLGVLGEHDQAQAIYIDAQSQFTNDANAQNRIRAAAKAAGIAP